MREVLVKTGKTARLPNRIAVCTGNRGHLLLRHGTHTAVFSSLSFPSWHCNSTTCFGHAADWLSLSASVPLMCVCHEAEAEAKDKLHFNSSPSDLCYVYLKIQSKYLLACLCACLLFEVFLGHRNVRYLNIVNNE